VTVQETFEPMPLARVISLKAKKEERARAQAPLCGDGCRWLLPSFAVHGLATEQKAVIKFKC